MKCNSCGQEFVITSEGLRADLCLNHRQVRLYHNCDQCGVVNDVTKVTSLTSMGMGFIMEKEQEILSSAWVDFVCVNCGRKAPVNLYYMHIEEDDGLLVFSVVCRKCGNKQDMTDDVPEDARVLVSERRDQYLDTLDEYQGVFCPRCEECYGAEELEMTEGGMVCPSGHLIKYGEDEWEQE